MLVQSWRVEKECLNNSKQQTHVAQLIYTEGFKINRKNTGIYGCNMNSALKIWLEGGLAKATECNLEG